MAVGWICVGVGGSGVLVGGRLVMVGEIGVDVGASSVFAGDTGEEVVTSSGSGPDVDTHPVRDMAAITTSRLFIDFTIILNIMLFGLMEITRLSIIYTIGTLTRVHPLRSAFYGRPARQFLCEGIWYSVH